MMSVKCLKHGETSLSVVDASRIGFYRGLRKSFSVSICGFVCSKFNGFCPLLGRGGQVSYFAVGGCWVGADRGFMLNRGPVMGSSGLHAVRSIGVVPSAKDLTVIDFNPRYREVRG